MWAWIMLWHTLEMSSKHAKMQKLDQNVLNSSSRKITPYLHSDQYRDKIETHLKVWLCVLKSGCLSLFGMTK